MREGLGPGESGRWQDARRKESEGSLEKAKAQADPGEGAGSSGSTEGLLEVFCKHLGSQPQQGTGLLRVNNFFTCL